MPDPYKYNTLTCTLVYLGYICAFLIDTLYACLSGKRLYQYQQSKSKSILLLLSCLWTAHIYVIFRNKNKIMIHV